MYQNSGSARNATARLMLWAHPSDNTHAGSKHDQLQQISLLS